MEHSHFHHRDRRRIYAFAADDLHIDLLASSVALELIKPGACFYLLFSKKRGRYLYDTTNAERVEFIARLMSTQRVMMLGKIRGFPATANLSPLSRSGQFCCAQAERESPHAFFVVL